MSTEWGLLSNKSSIAVHECRKCLIVLLEWMNRFCVWTDSNLYGTDGNYAAIWNQIPRLEMHFNKSMDIIDVCNKLLHDGRTYCWLRFCCWTCWICWGAGLLRDGSIMPGIPGRDTGLLPYPGGPMAGPWGVIRLEGGMPGLCMEK